MEQVHQEREIGKFLQRKRIFRNLEDELKDLRVEIGDVKVELKSCKVENQRLFRSQRDQVKLNSIPRQNLSCLQGLL